MFRLAVSACAFLATIVAAAQEELPKPFLHDGVILYDKEEVTPPHPRPREDALRDVLEAARVEPDPQRFHGTWRLISFENVDDDGRRRERPMRGQLTYTPDGLMSAQLMPKQEEEGDGSTRPYYAYFGTYEIDPDAKTVSHKVEGSNITAWVDTVLVRHYIFDESGRLLLTVKEDDRDVLILKWARTELPPKE